MTTLRSDNCAETAAALLDQYDRDGYVVVERAAGPDVVAAVADELRPWLGEGAHLGRNDFEGYSTNRVYALLAKAASVARLVEHPVVLALLDEVLSPNYLLSANLAINLLPGETAQSLHFDDSFYPLPRPRPALGVSAIWAIDDFTAANGATEVLPGSHRWAAEKPSDEDPRIVPVEMPAGSVVILAGTLWHRGGANRTNKPRLAVTPQYCEAWLRQQEPQMIAVGRRAADYSPRVQALLGYSIHPPFMGHVDGLHPQRLIDEHYDPAASGASKMAADFLASDRPQADSSLPSGSPSEPA
jgi:ectoine hydroxylase-related dioxygenase (phytanoyl-CoA dioxygenase family)